MIGYLVFDSSSMYNSLRFTLSYLKHALEILTELPSFLIYTKLLRSIVVIFFIHSIIHAS